MEDCKREQLHTRDVAFTFTTARMNGDALTGRKYDSFVQYKLEDMLVQAAGNGVSSIMSRAVTSRVIKRGSNVIIRARVAFKTEGAAEAFGARRVRGSVRGMNLSHLVLSHVFHSCAAYMQPIVTVCCGSTCQCLLLNYASPVHVMFQDHYICTCTPGHSVLKYLNS